MLLDRLPLSDVPTPMTPEEIDRHPDAARVWATAKAVAQESTDVIADLIGQRDAAHDGVADGHTELRRIKDALYHIVAVEQHRDDLAAIERRVDGLLAHLAAFK